MSRGHFQAISSHLPFTIVVTRLKRVGWTIEVEKDVSTTLKNNNVDLSSIDAIVWSHAHWDHTGDVSTFPASTKLVVGPSFQDIYLPGYPTNPDGVVLDSAFANRDLIHIDFDSSDLKIGRFRAVDYWGDGSFYLLDSPGHTVGHMCALARTTPDTFVLLGGDVCHYSGEIRPSDYMPLPAEISPDPRASPRTRPECTSLCPGAIYEAIHPQKSSTKPFLRLSEAPKVGYALAVDFALGFDSMHKVSVANVVCLIGH